MRWEVEQCMINPLDQYIVDFYLLPAEEGKDFEQILLVIARRLVIDYFKDIFKNTDLQLRAIDVDVFAAQRVFVGNYDAGQNEYVALVDVRKDRFLFSMMKGGSFYLSQELDYQSEDPADPQKRDIEHMARVISKELRRIIIDYKLGKSVEDMRAIYLYGDGVNDELLETLQNTHNVRIDRANPFKKIKIANQAGDSMASSQPESFVIPVGAALKGI
jgi:Tfp pilus assembly PilM family ATPase